MQNKEINKLLIRLKKEFNTGNYPGLCSTIYYINLNRKERDLLEEYIEKNVPWNKNTFWKKIRGKRLTNEYIWEVNNKELRNKWLDKHIKKTSL